MTAKIIDFFQHKYRAEIALVMELMDRGILRNIEEITDRLVAAEKLSLSRPGKRGEAGSETPAKG